jgi:hypothetical protein
VDLHAFTYTTGGLFIALDVVILILPIPCLVKLKMDRKKKINVIFSMYTPTCLSVSAEPNPCGVHSPSYPKYCSQFS